MNLLFEAKYAWRLLLKTPAFTATSIAIIGSSIAISMVVFVIVYRYSIKDLDFVDSERWFMVQTKDVRESNPKGPFSVDLYTFRKIQERRFNTLEKISGFQVEKVVLSDGDESVFLNAVLITPDLLAATQTTPLLGRNLTESDSSPGSDAVAMLSYEAWQTYYNGERDIVGRQTRVNGQFRTLVGVLPPGHSIVLSGDFWIPLIKTLLEEPSADSLISPLVLLKPGAALSAVENELNALGQSLRDQFPNFYNENHSLTLTSLPLSTATSGIPVYIAMGVVACVLTIFGAFNIGILLVARTMERNRELAIRAAVGGSRWRVAKQGLLETLLICVSGWLVGIACTYAAFTAINPLLVSAIEATGVGFPERWLLKLDTTGMVFSLVVTASVWILCCLAPFFQAITQDIAKALNSGSKGAGKYRGFKTASILVGAQTAIACFLLIISGTLVVSVTRSIHADFGIKRTNLATANIDLFRVYDTTEEKLQYLQRFEQELETVSSIPRVAFASALPTSAQQIVSYQLEDRRLGENNTLPTEPLATISNNYFSVIGSRIIEGRAFDGTDTEDSPPVVIVDEYFAKRYWPGESAIGKRIQLDPEHQGTWATVVGVSAHIRAAFQLAADNEFWLFRPLSQSIGHQIRLVAETSENLRASAIHLNQAAARVERNLPLSRITTLEGYLNDELVGLDVLGNIFSVVAVITLVLAVAGIFGVLANAIAGNRRNIGVRRAVGSGERKIVWLFMRRGIGFLVIGCSLGGALALLVNNLVFTGVMAPLASNFPTVAGIVIAGLSLSIVVASYLPVKQVVALEPGDALRYE